jgi:hypothetical protein
MSTKVPVGTFSPAGLAKSPKYAYIATDCGGPNPGESAMVSALSKITAHEWDGVVGFFWIFMPLGFMLWDDLTRLRWMLRPRSGIDRSKYF